MKINLKDNTMSMKEKFTIYPVGKVRKRAEKVFLKIFTAYQEAILGLKDYSHILVLYWFSENDTPEKRGTLQVVPRHNPENPLTGVFACCSPARPNLIATTVCKIVSIQENLIYIDDIDAFDGSPVIDIKPFFGNKDTDDIRIPSWAQ